MKTGKVLFYNWAPSFDRTKRGGGVSVYQDNCILGLQARNWEVHSLSAGLAYVRMGGDPYVRVDRTHRDRCVAFELVNSPVVAPACFSFFTNQISAGEITDRKVLNCLTDLIVKNGPYQIIHFNNLEGIPAAVLPHLRQRFPDTRFVFSLHNYYPMCPNVYLWRNDSRVCGEKEEGNACVSCLGSAQLASYSSLASDAVSSRLAPSAPLSCPVGTNEKQQKTEFLRKKIRAVCFGLNLQRAVTYFRCRFGQAFPFEAETMLQRDAMRQYFNTRQASFAQIINNSFDAVLCVSDRVRAIAESAGLSPDRLRVSYIGTKFYHALKSRHKHATKEAPLRLAFLGYANRFKGFDFFLEVLEQSPAELLKKLHILIAALGITPAIKERLTLLSSKLNGLTVREGYTHGDLNEMLSQVELGVVPVVWEDCLPQVAIEFVCHGVPIVTSDLGGAREIASDPAFQFRAGNHAELIEILAKFAADKMQLDQFWNNKLRLKSMETHILELMTHYGATTE